MRQHDTQSTLTSIFADLAYAIRRFRARSVSSMAIVLVLGVTIGLCVVLSYWVDALLFRPLPMPGASELTTFQRIYEGRGGTEHRTSMTWPQVQRLTRANGIESSAVLSAWDDPIARRLAIEWFPAVVEDVPVTFVSSNYGRVLRAATAIGRDLDIDDDRAGAPPVAVVSYQEWQRRWGGRADVLGSVVKVNDVPVTVVGVAGRVGWVTRLVAPGPALFLPLGSASGIGRAVGHDRPAASSGGEPSDAALEMSSLSRFQVIVRARGDRAALTAAARASLRSDQWTAVSLAETLLPFDTRQQLVRFVSLLIFAAGSTLLIASVNVAVLMFGAAHERRNEMSLRVALGATPDRIGQMFACDTLIVAAASGAGGYVVALAANGIIARLDLANVVVKDVFAADVVRMGAYASVFSVGVALLVGLFPVRWAISRAAKPLAESISVRGGRTSGALRLVVAAQAAACVVLSASGLYFVSVLVTGLQKDLGFDPSNLYHARVVLTPAQRSTIHAVHASNTILGDIAALPAVSEASIGPGPFFDSADGSTTEFHVDGQSVVTADPVDLAFVSPSYFAVLHQTLLRGRGFSPQDTATNGEGLVAILNEPAAALLWGGRNAIGDHLALDRFARSTGPTRGPADCVVVGIVPGAVTRNIGESPRPVIYLPLSQWADYRAGLASALGTVSMLVRTRETLEATTRLLGSAARARGLALDDVSSVVGARDAMLRPARLVGMMLMVMALASLAVSMIAIYAASQQQVARQQRATAIRLALGAEPSALLRKMIAPLAYALGAGTTTGVAGLALIRPHVEPLGLHIPFLRPFTVGLPVGLVMACGLTAAYMVARRVYNLQPASVLRD